MELCDKTTDIEADDIEADKTVEDEPEEEQAEHDATVQHALFYGTFATNFHSVQGKNIHAMLFDPGASSGLTGTQTLLDYSKECLEPHGITWTQVNTPETAFRGISGRPEVSKLRAKVPIDLGPFVSEYETDTIGGKGDRCPMLMPNKT